MLQTNKKISAIQDFFLQRGMELRYLDRCSSSNDIASEWAQDGWRGVLLVAEQTAGRGRLQRVWHSQKDKNLLFSWVLDVHCDLGMVPRIPLLIAAKIASVLHIFVKWPNDLVDKQYRKVGGILSSVLDVGEKSHTIVVGVGLNINQTEFGDIENAVSLKEIREKQEDIDILDVFVQIFSALQHMDLVDSLDGWKQYNLTVGKTVRINGIEGVVEGILDDGALVVAGQIIRTGDVHLI